MGTPVATRFSAEEIALIDELVTAGVGESRSAVIRRGVHHLAESAHRAHVGHTIASSYRGQPQTEGDDVAAMASAVAMAEAEPC